MRWVGQGRFEVGVVVGVGVGVVVVIVVVLASVIPCVFGLQL